MFRGAAKVTLDDKGRVVIPTKQRERLNERAASNRVIVTVDKDRCLQIYAPADWTPVEQWLKDQPRMDEAARSWRRLIIGHATELDFDSHGRLSLTPELREFAGLKRTAMLVGQLDYFELWDADRWDEINANLPSSAPGPN